MVSKSPKPDTGQQLHRLGAVELDDLARRIGAGAFRAKPVVSAHPAVLLAGLFYPPCPSNQGPDRSQGLGYALLISRCRCNQGDRTYNQMLGCKQSRHICSRRICTDRVRFLP